MQDYFDAENYVGSIVLHKTGYYSTVTQAGEYLISIDGVQMNYMEFSEQFKYVGKLTNKQLNGNSSSTGNLHLL